MYHFCTVKKIGLNFYFEIIFVLPFYDLEQSPVITKPCLVIYRQLFFALVLSSRGFGSRQILTKFSDKVSGRKYFLVTVNPTFSRKLYCNL